MYMPDIHTPPAGVERFMWDIRVAFSPAGLRLYPYRTPTQQMMYLVYTLPKKWFIYYIKLTVY